MFFAIHFNQELLKIELCRKLFEMVVSTDPQREQVLKLIEEKEKIEKKIADLGLVLQTVCL